MKAIKSLLLSALMLDAVSATCQTTNISINIVAGYNLITLPLQSADTNSSINRVLTNTSPVMPFGAYALTWNPVLQNYNAYVYAGGDGNWYDDTFTLLSTNRLPPGTGFFVYLPGPSGGGYSSLTITDTGTVLQGTSSIYENQAYGFYGNFEPVAGDLTTNGFPITASFSSYLYTWNPTTQRYNGAEYGITAADNGGTEMFSCGCGFDFPVVPAVGQGFVYFNGGAAAYWTQVYPPQ